MKRILCMILILSFFTNLAACEKNAPITTNEVRLAVPDDVVLILVNANGDKYWYTSPEKVADLVSYLKDMGTMEKVEPEFDKNGTFSYYVTLHTASAEEKTYVISSEGYIAVERTGQDGYNWGHIPPDTITLENLLKENPPDIYASKR